MSLRLPRHLVLALVASESLGLALVARSLLLGRVTTVVVATLLVVGAQAALRERTWGVGLLLGTATAFGVAAATGFGPGWFAVVAALSALPFAMTLGPMVRFDGAAAATFAMLSTALGAAGAMAWREAAYALWHATHPWAPYAHAVRHHCHR